MTTLNLTVLLVVIGVVVLAGIVWMAARRQHSKELKESFGPEYDYTVEKAGDKRSAEDELEDRKKRIDNLGIHDLSVDDMIKYRIKWNEIQANFVENPSKSVEDGNQLISDVMVDRGFPAADFEQRASDLSVLYPEIVSTYRTVEAIILRNKEHASTTEELRQAMIYIHSIVEVVSGSQEMVQTIPPEKVMS